MNPTSPQTDSRALPLDLLCCPITRSKLTLSDDGLTLTATAPEGLGLRYPIRDGIPVLLPEEATLPDGYDTLEAFQGEFGVR